MSWSKKQRKTISGIKTGFHINKGEPCECGPESYNTSKRVGYSDFVTYKHRCGNCSNVFETYIEG